MPAPKGNQNAVGNKGGAPSGYRPEYAARAAKACEAGFTDKELGELFGVNESTIYKWKLEHVDFGEALKSGKGPADDRVERSLFHRALGYSYDAVKIFCNRAGEVTKVPYREHVPPDTTACIFWLKNRRSKEWRDVQKHEHQFDFENMNAAELTASIARDIASLSEEDRAIALAGAERETSGSGRTH